MRDEKATACPRSASWSASRIVSSTTGRGPAGDPERPGRRGSGTQRLYSFQDLVMLRVIKKLLDTGVSLQRIRKAVDYLQPPEGRARGRDADVRRHRIYAAHRPRRSWTCCRGSGRLRHRVGRVWDDLTNSSRRGGRPPPRSPGPGARRRPRAASGPHTTRPTRRRVTVEFAHASERQFASLLDFYQIEWQYEPTLLRPRVRQGRQRHPAVHP